MRLITVQLNFLNIRYRCGMQSNGLAPELHPPASVIVKTRRLRQSYQLAISRVFVGLRCTEEQMIVFRLVSSLYFYLLVIVVDIKIIILNHDGVFFVNAQ